MNRIDDMIKCINNGDLECLKVVIKDPNVRLTGKILTILLVTGLEHNNIPICTYILRHSFEIDGEIFDKYLKLNRPFTEKQIRNLNAICNAKLICCLLD